MNLVAHPKLDRPFSIILVKVRIQKLVFKLLFAKINAGLLFSTFQNTLNSKHNMASTKITVLNNGSLKIDGDFEIVDKEGNAYNLQGRPIVSLCRCGLSANKPFCDGSHKNHFEHDAVAFDLPPRK